MLIIQNDVRKQSTVFLELCGVHCKNGYRFSCTLACRMSLTKLFLARESLVGDIPDEDGNIGNLFLQCSMVNRES
jgi:hypothetical protein